MLFQRTGLIRVKRMNASLEQKKKKKSASGAVPVVDVWFLTAFNMKYVAMVTTGAAAEKASRCPWICFFSRPECMRKETKPKAAGACKTTKAACDRIHH